MNRARTTMLTTLALVALTYAGAYLAQQRLPAAHTVIAIFDTATSIYPGERGASPGRKAGSIDFHPA